MCQNLGFKISRWLFGRSFLKIMQNLEYLIHCIWCIPNILFFDIKLLRVRVYGMECIPIHYNRPAKISKIKIQTLSNHESSVAWFLSGVLLSSLVNAQTTGTALGYWNKVLFVDHVHNDRHGPENLYELFPNPELRSFGVSLSGHLQLVCSMHTKRCTVCLKNQTIASLSFSLLSMFSLDKIHIQ